VGSGAWLAPVTWDRQHVEIFAGDRYQSPSQRVPAIKRAFWDERTGWRGPPVLASLPALGTPTQTAVQAIGTSVQVTWRDDEGSALRYEIWAKQTGTAFPQGDKLVQGGLVPGGNHQLRSTTVGGFASGRAYEVHVCLANGTQKRCAAAAPIVADATPQ
jgi:hypothetical protein